MATTDKSLKWEQYDDLWIDSNLMTRHCLGIAATGAGKTNFLNLILKQQMMRGGGVIHIDGKNSNESIQEFLDLARQHNRWQDVRVINIDNENYSNTYNPLLRGDAEELASRIMMLIPEGKADPYFRGQASKGLSSICALLKRIGLPINFQDFVTLMEPTGVALRWFAEQAPKDCPEYRDFRTNFYNQLMETDRRTGAMVLSDKKVQHTFGDLGGKLSAYTVGAARSVLNDYNPEVDLLKAIKENQLVYIALPMLRKQETAINFAKFLLSDLRTAIGSLQNEVYKPHPTFLVLMDEFSSYAMPSIATVFEQARSANICLFPFIQTTSSLTDKERGLSTDFESKVLGNTWNKVVFKLKDPVSCEKMSDIAGEKLVQVISQTEGQNISFASGQDDASVLRAGGRGKTFSRSVSEQYEKIVRPEEFANLEVGEGIFMGHEVIKLRVPHVQINFRKDGLDFPRFRMPKKQGLSVQEHYENLTSKVV